MVSVLKADESHVEGIVRVCTEANWATYRDLYTDTYIKRVINEFYNEERVRQEVESESRDWGGYFVAVEGDRVIGAGGGGMIDHKKAEVYVLYLDPGRRNEGIGSLLLDAITRQQREYGALEQWVSVQEGNELGIPFYLSRGFQVKERQRGYANTEEDDYDSIRLARKI